MKILCIIVTFNPMKWVDRCLESIRQSSVPLDAMVVDNGSLDGSQTYIKEHYPECKFYQNEENLGFGRANNIGMQYALDNDYDYVYLLNQDAWLMPDTIQLLIDESNAHPEYGILSPFQLSGGVDRIDRNFAAGVCAYESNPNLLNDLYFNRLKDVYPVHSVMAAHWFITRACLKKVGGFSPTFPHYGEDNNYCARAIFHGFSVGIVPGAVAVHDRENREFDKDKDIYCNYYIFQLKFMSSPLLENKHPFCRLFYHTIRTVLKKKSIKPISYMIRIFREYSGIKQNKAKSLESCAFLNNSTEDATMD